MAARLEHPALEELVLLHSGELGTDRTAEVEAHMAVCPACLDRYGRLKDTYCVVAAAVDSRPNRLPRAARKWVAVTVAAAALAYLLTQGTTSARADSLLSRAGDEERKPARQRQVVRIQSDGLECHLLPDAGSAVHATRGQTCEAISAAIRQSGWTASELLSPRKFQQWRRSVSKREDVIQQSDTEMRVTTRTSEGVLQLASLRLRRSDHRAVAAHYEFAVQDSGRARIVDVTEVEELPLNSSEATASRTAPSRPPPLSPATGALNPLDASARREAQARLVLHEAGADGNVLMAVERTGARIRVWGVAGDDRMRDILVQQLEAIGGIQVQLASEREQQEAEQPTPWNPNHGDAPPLALKQIDSLFPNRPAARQQYLNGLDGLARQVAGSARDREAVLLLRRRLAGSPEADLLEKPAASLDHRVRHDLSLLREQLSLLLTEIPVDTGGRLTGREGLELYNLVQQIAILSNRDGRQSADEAAARLAILAGRK